MDIELKNKISSLENNYSDEALNYLKAISPSIGAPAIDTGCFCKQSSKIEWSRRFYMWWNTVKNLD